MDTADIGLTFEEAHAQALLAKDELVKEHNFPEGTVLYVLMPRPDHDTEGKREWVWMATYHDALDYHQIRFVITHEIGPVHERWQPEEPSMFKLFGGPEVSDDS